MRERLGCAIHHNRHLQTAGCAGGAGGAAWAGAPQPPNCARLEPATGVSLMAPSSSTTFLRGVGVGVDVMGREA